MTTCTIHSGDETISFPCRPDASVLDAALAAGWELPYSCLKGVCDSCRTPVVSGQTQPSAAPDGSVLLCQARALTDLVIVPARVERRSATSRKTVRAKVYRIRWPADDVAILDLRFAAGIKVAFKAGQFLHVLMEGLEPRCFSMANAPRSSDGVQLHIRIVPGGVFSEKVLPTLAAGDEVALELPFGGFHLRDDVRDRRVVLVAGGTGFAPMQSILDDALARNPDRQFVLYWGARDETGLYALDQIERWKRRFPNFSFVPVISGESEGHDMRKGFVHEAVLEDHLSLAGCDVYVCGAPALVQAAKSVFIEERGLPADRFFADAFATTGSEIRLTAAMAGKEDVAKA
jgi:NAD(P)H-flavin reductase/ferredoxin